MAVPGAAVVIVPTYKRNDWLQELLAALVKQLGVAPGSSVMVIDNSPEGEAAEVVAAAALTAADSIRYVHEPVPGIVAARNRALEEISTSSDLFEYILFIDDDELPSENWLQTHISALVNSAADAAIGPVVPILPDSVPEVLRRGGFFDRIRLPTGSAAPWGTTNNTIVRWSAIQSMKAPRFSSDFSMSGGSDAEFFWRFVNEGKTLLWVDEAVVFERFSEERATWRWITRRNIRLGNVSARLKLRTQSGPRILGIGIARLCYGAAASLIWVLSLRAPRAADYAHIFKGFGMISEVFGGRIIEYKRKSA